MRGSRQWRELCRQDHSYRANAGESVLKYLIKPFYQKSDFENVKREAKIGLKLRHENLVQMHANYFHPTQYYLVFDLIIGGELFEEIVKRDHYSEEDASRMIKQVMSGIQFCHANGIIHRGKVFKKLGILQFF